MLKAELQSLILEHKKANKPIIEKQYELICWRLKDTARHGEFEYRHDKKILDEVVERLKDKDGLDVVDCSYFSERFGGFIYKYIIKGW